MASFRLVLALGSCGAWTTPAGRSLTRLNFPYVAPCRMSQTIPVGAQDPLPQGVLSGTLRREAKVRSLRNRVRAAYVRSEIIS